MALKRMEGENERCGEIEKEVRKEKEKMSEGPEAKRFDKDTITEWEYEDEK
jgi:hypothetical protein